MAATEPPASSGAAALRALTLAALALPGLAPSPLTAAESGDDLTLQHAWYEEGRRDLRGVESGIKPLAAHTLQGALSLAVRDALGLSLNFTQDAWSGATPVTTSPFIAGGNRPVLRNTPQGLVTSGASPIVQSRIALTRDLQPARVDAALVTVDPRAVLVMSSASPELRRQLDAALTREHEGGALTLGGGVSTEDDYLSRFVNVSGRLDFNQALTSLKFGAGYTHSRTAALLDPDLLPYLARGNTGGRLERVGTTERLRGTRSDRSFTLGLTQVLDAASVVDLSLGYTRSGGFLENPYKATTVVFVPPAAFAAPVQAVAAGDVRALLEQRPDGREQFAAGAHYARHFASTGGALHLDYDFSTDDWDIRTHSLEAQWIQPLGAWTLTPRLRYYTQSAAGFYTDWLVSRQDYRSIALDEGRQVWQAADGTPYYRQGFEFVDAGGKAVNADALDLQPRFVDFSYAQLPEHFSSDHRLAAFGSASASLSLARDFGNGMRLEAGVEYYERASGLEAGGDGDSRFADFDFTLFHVGLSADLGATSRRLRRESAATAHAAHAGHAEGMAHAAPAGLMFAHMPMQAGTWMAGYRVAHSLQRGGLRRGGDAVDDASVVAQACSAAQPCRYAPARMAMTMYMPDLMYAASDRVTLMFMPQFMTMDMELRELAGRPPPVPGVHEHGSMGSHESAALGDTIVATLVQLGGGWHASLGLGIPTGKTGLAYRRSFGTDGGLMHFDMQTGSGTWDFLPALTWNGAAGAWALGAQASATTRLQERNDTGYRLGDALQLSAWASHPLTSWLGASLRGAWSTRGDIDGDFAPYSARSGPMDFPANQGGDFLDLGIGLSFTLAGSELALEWLQPLHERFNGVQLERAGSLSATWRYGF